MEDIDRFWKILTIVFIFSVVFLREKCSGTTIGSDTSISQENFYTFDGTGNKIASGATMKEGFGLQDSQTTCSYDSNFWVRGSILLNGGTLYLTKDLVLQKESNLSNAGTFKSSVDSHAITFAGKDLFEFPISSVASNFSELTNQSISYKGFSVDWSYDDAFIAVGRRKGPGDEFYVYSFDGSVLTLKDSVNYSNDANVVRWHPSAHYVAVGCEVQSGAELFVYYFNPATFSLSQTSSREIGVDVYGISWRPQGDYLVYGLADTTNEIRIQRCINGILGGTVETYDISPSQKVKQKALSWSPTGKYFVAGFEENSGNDDLRVFKFEEANFGLGNAISQVASDELGIDVLAVDWSPSDTYIAVGLKDGTERLRVYSFIASTNSLTEQTSARVGESVGDVNEVHWNSSGNCLAFARDYGSSSELRTYQFDESLTTLSLICEEALSDDVKAIRWAPSNSYFAITGESDKVHVYELAGSSDTFVFDNVHLCFNSDVTVSTTLKFLGNCAVLGNGTRFNLAQGSYIKIGPSASLYMRNLKVGGLGDGSSEIIFFDNAGEVRLANVDVELTDNVTTTIGNIYVEGPSTWYLKNYSWTFDQAATLTVDGTTLWKDSACQQISSAGDINVGASYQHLDTVNCGTIKWLVSKFEVDTAVAAGGGGDHIINIPYKDSITDFSSPQTLDYLQKDGSANNRILRDNLYVAPNRKLRITADSLLSGSGFSIHFASCNEPLLFIDDGITFSTKNVTLTNFSPKYVRYGNATSTLIFDEGTVIDLAGNDALKATVNGVADTDITWTMRSNVLLKGRGNSLSLGSNPSGIEVEPNSTLTVHHLRLTGLGGVQLSSNDLFGTRPYNLRLKSSASRLDLRESKLVLSGNYSVTEGKINFYEDVDISGTFTFAYQSPRDLTISSNSKLLLDRGCTFSYDAAPEGGDSLDDTKSKIVFTDASSVLHLKGSTLYCTPTGLKLNGGTVIVEDNCLFKSEARVATEAAVLAQSSSNIQILGDAILNLEGLVEVQ